MLELTSVGEHRTLVDSKLNNLLLKYRTVQQDLGIGRINTAWITLASVIREAELLIAGKCLVNTEIPPG